MDILLRECIERLQFLHKEMNAAIGGLPPEALDWTPGPGMNSLGVLAIHTAGAERYWLGDVLAGEPSGRDRDAEFQARDLDALALQQRLDESLRYGTQVLQGLSQGDLATEHVSPRDGRKFSAGWCILHTMEHTAIHVGHMQLMRQMWQKHGQAK